MSDTQDPFSKNGKQRRSLKRLKPLPVRNMLPNMLTILALCSGLTAIRFALESDFKASIIAVVVAAVLDGIDGRVARLLKGSSKFGAELDSLSDFANFGIVPVTVLYIWTLNGLGGIGWVVVLAFSICCVLRLARFNVALEDPDKPAWKRDYFVGVPAPAAAGLCISPVFLSFLDIEWVRQWQILTAFYVCGVAFLMISRIPTFSGKGIKVKSEQVLPLLLCVALFAALLVNFPWHTLFACAVVYLALIPVSVVIYQREERRHDHKGDLQLSDLDVSDDVLGDPDHQDQSHKD